MEYLRKNCKDTYYEASVGSPGKYAQERDKKTKKRRNKRYVSKRTDFVCRDGFIAKDVKEGPLFKCDGENAFEHKKRANVRVSTRKQRFTRPTEVATDFYFNYQQLFSSLEEFDLDKHIVVDGCFDTNRHTIQQQIDCRNPSGSVLPNDEDNEIFKQSIVDTIRKLQIEELGDVNIESVYDFDFNLSTKPGYRFEHYLNRTSKSECVDEAVALAKRRFKTIVKRSSEGKYITRSDIIPGIYTIGARNNRMKTYDDCELALSRAIHMPEWHVEIHGGCFSDLLTSSMVERGRGPIYIGNSFVDFDRLERAMLENNQAVEGDWSKYDASICNCLITYALCICRLYFPRGIVYDNHFLAILDSLVIKDYHVVGGRVLRILHGLPSGSKWTSIIGSIINLLVLNHCFTDVKYYDRAFAIGGDDFVTFIRNDDYDLDEIQEVVTRKSEAIGFNLKYFKIKRYKNSEDINDYPIFYKYTVFNGVPVINMNDVVLRTFSPWNKRYKNNREVLTFLDNLMPSLGCPTTGCLLFYYFYMYVYFRVVGKKITLSSIYNRHIKIYNKIIENKISYFLHGFSSFNCKRNVYVNEIRLSKFVLQVFCLDPVTKSDS